MNARIEGIDLLICNLIPSRKRWRRAREFAEALENIDIGGPAMIRAAAKNHEWVTVVVDPEDYAPLLAELVATGGTRADTRRKFAQTAYARTAAYDASVSNWLAGELAKSGEERPPRRRAFAGRLREALRYGENPHQQAAFYVTGEKRYGVATATQLQGKELSYNNITDTEAAYELVAEFGSGTRACAIIKHANPCGSRCHRRCRCLQESARVRSGQRVRGCFAFNTTLEAHSGGDFKDLHRSDTAPDADAGAADPDGKNLRPLIADGLPDPREADDVPPVAGGLLTRQRGQRCQRSQDRHQARRRSKFPTCLRSPSRSM